MIVPRSTWLSVATAAGVFAFIVLAVMLGLYAQPVGENPLDSPHWLGLRAELEGQPGNPATMDEIRALDLDLRRTYFHRRERIRRGGAILLASLVVFLTAFKLANRRSLPDPSEPEAPEPDAERDRRSARARRAVAAAGALLGLGAALLWVTTPPGAARPSDETAVVAAGPIDAGPPSRAECAEQWPSFRGHDGSGVARTGDAPLEWDAPAGTNVAWKTPLSLPGASSPIVWGNRVFLTGSDGKREEVDCIDAETGAVLWRKALIVAGRRSDVREPMEDTGFAAPTAATDGRFVFVAFASGRVAALDMEGRQVWLRSFGPLENTYGHSSSLVCCGEHVLVQLDQAYTGDGKSRLVALDAKTGRTVWETPREVDTSWASPIVVDAASGPQVVLSATPFVAAYDPTTGAEVWRAEVMSGEVGPSPTGRDGVVYVAQEGAGLHAIGTDGAGDVTEFGVRWSANGFAPDVTSPVCDGDRVYTVTTSGTLTCVRAASGEVVYEQEMGAEFYSSPTIAGDVIYLTSMAGETIAVRVGDAYEEIRRNPLGESVVASFAFAPGRIYIRGKSHLFAIGAGAR